MASRRVFIGGVGLLASACFIAYPRSPLLLASELPKFDLEKDVPIAFAGWSVDRSVPVVLPAPDLEERINKTYSQTLARTYVNERLGRVMLMIAYGQDQRDRTTVAHLPEACYPAQGFVLGARRTGVIRVDDSEIRVVQLVARSGPRVEPISYWTTIGDHAFNAEIPRRIARARYALRDEVPDGMLVRVSSIDSEAERAYSVHEEFLSDFRRALTPSVSGRIFGRSEAG
jgi:EpsI family protein